LFKNGDDALATSGVYIANAANNRAYNFQQNADGSSLNLWAYGGSSWANRLTVQADGNVGIGATDPLRKLHVVGNFAVNAATDEYYGVNITGGEGANPTILIGDWHNSSANISWNSAGNYLRIDAQHSTSGAPIVFSGNDSAIEYMRINSSGNVGIGTTSPGAKLDVVVSDVSVVPNGNSSAVFRRNGDNYISILSSTSGEGGVLFGNSSDAVDGWIAYKNGSGNQYMTIGTADTEKMRITSSGDVGIGTTSPSRTLDVRGDAQILSTSSTGLRIVGGTTSEVYMIFGDADDNSMGGFGYNNNTNELSIDVNNSEAIRIDSSRNVGIGTTSPGSKLHVQGTSFFFDQSIFDDKVGIGTTNPAYKLQVNGGAQVGGVVTYSKNYSSLNTTGNAVAGLTAGFNGASAGFTFTCFGDTGGYQKIVYSCYNGGGTWYANKVIDEGTNDFDIEASANGTTITFTFKSTSGTRSYTPRVTVEATGSAINSTYA